MEKLKDIVDIKHDLVEAVKAEMAQGIEQVDTEEMGEVVDMIKDLASAEKSCMEAAYYELVCEAMQGEDAAGYDRWRYSSGRFAPKGRGSVRGYLPPYMDGETLEAKPMGYDRTDGRTRANGSTYDQAAGRSMRYGYTPESMGMHDGMSSKEKMDKAIDVMGDIWADATKAERETLKTCVQDLLYQMEQA